MVIGVCTIHLELPGCHSLKEKRRIVKSILARLSNEFNISVAEVGKNEAWQQAVLGVASVSNDQGYLHGLLTKVVRSIEKGRFDAQVVDYEIEIL
jgi:uncharacterized protein YlxP (DUF503 family)